MQSIASSLKKKTIHVPKTSRNKTYCSSLHSAGPLERANSESLSLWQRVEKQEKWFQQAARKCYERSVDFFSADSQRGQEANKKPND
eukprot:scaffold8400_cov95-Cylindrotheca_fusiformis.AAC.2